MIALPEFYLFAFRRAKEKAKPATKYILSLNFRLVSSIFCCEYENKRQLKELFGGKAIVILAFSFFFIS